MNGLSLRMLRPLVVAAGPEVELRGRELLRLVVEAEGAPLYPPAPGWVRTLTRSVGTDEGVSPELLEAVSGELSGWDPASLEGRRVGLLGVPLELLNGEDPESFVSSLSDLGDGDREAAERVRRNVRTAARWIRRDRARLVHVLEYYVGLGRRRGTRTSTSNRALVRSILGRYLYRLLEELPRARALELLESFPDPGDTGKPSSSALSQPAAQGRQE